MKKMLNKVNKRIKKAAINLTQPIRQNKVWQFLRRTIIRSPFRGYFVNSWRELKNVEWPNRATSWKLTFVVIIFSVFFALLTTSLDWGFERIAKQIFLK